MPILAQLDYDLHMQNNLQTAAPTSSAPMPGQFLDSSPLLGNPTALLERAASEGYLFFKGLLPVADVLEVRRDILAVVERHGWRQPGSHALDGQVDLDAINRTPNHELRSDIGVTTKIYEDVQRLESLHRLPHHPRLLALYKDLFGGRKVLAHPRHIARMMTPHPSLVPTPPHQDFPLIQGTSNTWTCWFPVGDCPTELGGLSVLRGSHLAGYLPIQFAEGAGNIVAQLCDGENQWVEGDYACGDVLTFPSHTVHKALKCKVRDSIRLSLDVRFQPSDEPIEAKSLKPHCDLTWEELYTGWTNEALQYYWEKNDLEFSPWDDALMQPSRRIC
jgi:ectoine hydroxylase-related dioxygenase (phytanoyl-CoA dioxygenase family)